MHSIPDTAICCLDDISTTTRNSSTSAHGHSFELNAVFALYSMTSVFPKSNPMFPP